MSDGWPPHALGMLSEVGTTCSSLKIFFAFSDEGLTDCDEEEDCDVTVTKKTDDH